MKRRFILTSVYAVFVVGSLFSQTNNQSGVYLTNEDFSRNHLSKEGKVNYSIFAPNKLILKNDAKKIVIAKDSIIGIKKSDGVYRMFQNQEFKILNSSDNLLIYSKKSLPK